MITCADLHKIAFNPMWAKKNRKKKKKTNFTVERRNKVLKYAESVTYTALEEDYRLKPAGYLFVYASVCVHICVRVSVTAMASQHKRFQRAHWIIII